MIAKLTVWPTSAPVGHKGTVSAVAIAPNGTWLVTASRDKTARLRAADGAPGDIRKHDRSVNAATVSRDGTI